MSDPNDELLAAIEAEGTPARTDKLTVECALGRSSQDHPTPETVGAAELELARLNARQQPDHHMRLGAHLQLSGHSIIEQHGRPGTS